jgi:RNA polymerase sigma factor for flagellar operon FliA
MHEDEETAMPASSASARARARKEPEIETGPGRGDTWPRKAAREEAVVRGMDARDRTAGNEIVQGFLPTIRHLARKMAKGFGNEGIADDLVAAGVVALLEVLKKYDPARAKLNTFAYMRIRGAMIDELRSMDWFPKSARAKARKIRKAAARLECRMGRRPDEEEMAREMNMDPEKYVSMLSSCGNLSMVSLEEAGGDSEEGRDEAHNCLVDHGMSPERHAEARELKRIVTVELRKLPEKQRRALTLYYREGMNMKEVAARLGVTEARVSQIHCQALVALRPRMRKYLVEE